MLWGITVGFISALRMRNIHSNPIWRVVRVEQMSSLPQLAESEDSKEVVKTICDTTAELAKELGPAADRPTRRDGEGTLKRRIPP